MNNKQLHKVSKFLSLVLRHKPETIGVELDPQGWVSVNDLIKGMKSTGTDINLKHLIQIVEDDDKNRYSFKGHNSMIRANQGHSIKVDLGLVEKKPPHTLYHGTPEKFMSDIRLEGLKPMKRHHVHLSSDESTANSVGSRRGTPFIINIDAELMHKEGIKFYQSENGVWLTDFVSPQYFKN